LSNDTRDEKHWQPFYIFPNIQRWSFNPDYFFKVRRRRERVVYMRRERVVREKKRKERRKRENKGRG
jgi:hypothetical protein